MQVKKKLWIKILPPIFFPENESSSQEKVLQNFRKFLCVVSKKFHSKGLT